MQGTDNIHPSLNDASTVCIASVMKSGTHWMRYLFANYQKLLTLDRIDDAGAVTYDQLQSIYSPTDRRLCIRQGQEAKSSRIYPMHGIKSVFWQHVDQNLATYEGRIVFIYRNPLDYAVSRYFYDKARWEAEGRDVSSVSATIAWSVEWYARGIRVMFDMMKTNPRILPVTYEELKMAPVAVMGIVFRWAGFPHNPVKLRKAVELSDASNVRKEEETRQKPIVGPTSEGYFVRDSSVGQWRKHLSDDDVRRAASILSRQGLRLENFITN